MRGHSNCAVNLDFKNRYQIWFACLWTRSITRYALWMCEKFMAVKIINTSCLHIVACLCEKYYLSSIWLPGSATVCAVGEQFRVIFQSWHFSCACGKVLDRSHVWQCLQARPEVGPRPAGVRPLSVVPSSMALIFAGGGLALRCDVRFNARRSGRIPAVNVYNSKNTELCCCRPCRLFTPTVRCPRGRGSGWRRPALGPAVQ